MLDKLGFDEETGLVGIKLYGGPMFQVIGPANQLRQAALANRRSWSNSCLSGIRSYDPGRSGACPAHACRLASVDHTN